MRKCNNCDIVLQDKDLFCPNCGMSTEELPEEAGAEAAAETAEETVAEAAEGAEAVQTEYRNPAAQANEEKKTKKKKTGLVIGIIALLLAAAAAAVFFITKGAKNKPMARFYNAQTKLLRAASDRAGAEKEDALEEFLRGRAEIGLR